MKLVKLIANLGYGSRKDVTQLFRAGQVHRMALEGSMDQFKGGILNKYSAEDPDPIYWAVWTNLVGG